MTPNEPQLLLGKEKAFTFDEVFDINSEQFSVYDLCVRQLIDGYVHFFDAFFKVRFFYLSINLPVSLSLIFLIFFSAFFWHF